MNSRDPRMASKAISISSVTRHAIIDLLLLRDEPFHGRRFNLIDFLLRVLPLGTLPSTDSRYGNLYDDLFQHTIQNNDYSDIDVLFRHVRIFNVPDKIFGSFLTETLHPVVRDSDVERRELLTIYNTQLQADKYTVVPSGEISGRPLYKVQRLESPIINAKCADLSAISVVEKAVDAVKVAPNVYAALENNEMREQSALLRKYDVVLSYAGQQREYVEQVAKHLNSNGIRVFYDGEHIAELWGKNLVDTLGAIYDGDARFCVMFISKAYADKDWTNLERQHALAKALRDREEYVLPIRFDNSVLPGLALTVKYLLAEQYRPEEIATLIVRKLSLFRGTQHS